MTKKHTATCASTTGTMLSIGGIAINATLALAQLTSGEWQAQVLPLIELSADGFAALATVSHTMAQTCKNGDKAPNLGSALQLIGDVAASTSGYVSAIIGKPTNSFIQITRFTASSLIAAGQFFKIGHWIHTEHERKQRASDEENPRYTTRTVSDRAQIRNYGTTAAPVIKTSNYPTYQTPTPHR